MKAVLAGQAHLVGLEPPAFDEWDIVRFADWVRDRAGRPRLCPDPRHLAERFRIPVIDRVPPCHPPECCNGYEIRYRWHSSPRVRGYRVGHGFSHGAFTHAGWFGHTEADAILLTAELLLPTAVAARVRSLHHAKALSLHAPEWLLVAQMSAALSRIRAA